jgi:hypothetical protein
VSSLINETADHRIERATVSQAAGQRGGYLECSCGKAHTILSITQKMPCPSFSIPATLTCPGKQGDICDQCYASRGKYALPETERAQAARWYWVFNDRTWYQTMIKLINHPYNSRSPMALFRIHDSGDFYNRRYAREWLRVVESCPETQFWAPTRSYRFGWPELLAMSALPNASVRPSAYNFEDLPPQVPGYAAGTSASRTPTCPAHLSTNPDGSPKAKNTCGDCRLCWNKTTPIYYRRH